MKIEIRLSNEKILEVLKYQVEVMERIVNPSLEPLKTPKGETAIEEIGIQAMMQRISGVIGSFGNWHTCR